MKKIENFIKKQFETIRYYEIKFPFIIVSVVAIIGIYLRSITFGDSILLLTLGALLWYSFETRQLKNETKTTNEFQISPSFVFIYNEDKDLILKNVGKGVAYNIFVDPILIGEQQFELGFLKKWYYCEAGEERKLPLSINQNGTRQLHRPISDLINAVYSKMPDHKIKIYIKFNSKIKNFDYQAVVLVVKDQIGNVELQNFDL
ncbi:MAG: hypothetical protein WC928_02815 [Patescibacteria group bacterium]|jgi:hypothetical protein